MLKFLFGVIIGAVGYWAYTFWKGGEDVSWDQPFSSSGSSSTSYPSYNSQPVGSTTSGESSTTPPSSAGSSSSS
jgi:hypothetical protein